MGCLRSKEMQIGWPVDDALLVESVILKIGQLLCYWIG